MCRMDYHEPRGVYGDDGRTHRKLLAVCQLIFDCNGKQCLSVEKVFFFFFLVEVKLIDWPWGGM